MWDEATQIILTLLHWIELIWRISLVFPQYQSFHNDAVCDERCYWNRMLWKFYGSIFYFKHKKFKSNLKSNIIFELCTVQPHSNWINLKLWLLFENVYAAASMSCFVRKFDIIVRREFCNWFTRFMLILFIHRFIFFSISRFTEVLLYIISITIPCTSHTSNKRRKNDQFDIHHVSKLVRKNRYPHWNLFNLSEMHHDHEITLI